MLGTRLRERDSWDVLLTENGTTLWPKACHILEESARLMAEMPGLFISGKLRIGLLEYIGPHCLPDIMTAMQRKLPAAGLQLSIGLISTQKSALSKGGIDLVLALHDPESATSIIVAGDKLVWVESESNHPHVITNALDLCLMQALCVHQNRALGTIGLLGLVHRIIMTGNSVQPVQNAVPSGSGVTITRSSCLSRGLNLSRRLEEVAARPTMNSSLHREDHRMSGFQACCRMCVECTRIRQTLTGGKSINYHNDTFLDKKYCIENHSKLRCEGKLSELPGADRPCGWHCCSCGGLE